MTTPAQTLKNNEAFARLFTPIAETQQHCDKHGLDYTERRFANYTTGCPECAAEQQAEREAAAAADELAKHNRLIAEDLARRFGLSGIPKRFAQKTVKGYQADTPEQELLLERIKAYAWEFTKGHTGRNLALIGNAGTGKTHLACALANHVIRNCGGTAQFVTVGDLNRKIRESKGFGAAANESTAIAAFAACDLLVIDEVGVQSGTDAEARALFDVFNERYQQMRPTVLISNLDAAGFVNAVGVRIADRLKEDGGEVLLFGWDSYRG